MRSHSDMPNKPSVSVTMGLKMWDQNDQQTGMLTVFFSSKQFLLFTKYV